MKESAKAFVNKAADELQNTFESIGESVSKGWNSFTTWCGEHKDTLYAVGSAVLIGGLAIATVFCPALAPITIGACAGFISGFGISVATSVVSSTIQNGFGNYDWDGILRQANKEAFWGAATGALFSGASMAASKALSKLGPKAANTVKEISGCVNVVDDYVDDAGRALSTQSGSGMKLDLQFFAKKANTVDDYVDDVGRAMTNGGKVSPNRLGKQGENFVSQQLGLPHNTQTFSINGRDRIPDFIDKSRGIIAESKNVAKQSYTRQLRDYVDMATEMGTKLELYVRQNTKLSKTLQEVIDQGQIIINYFSW